MANVFLSHAAADRGRAEKVYGWLVADRHDVFLDVAADGIPAGEPWPAHIYERLRWATALVCVVTAEYNQSQWCFAELVAALVVGCPVVPVSAEAGVVHPVLADIQHVAMDGMDDDAPRERLLSRIRTLSGSPVGSWPAGRTPFPGLAPFGADMEAAFCGRSAEIDAVVRGIRSAGALQDRHVLMVIGPSGCGKSSLVRAGLIPAIVRQSGWLSLSPVSAGGRPLTRLAGAFAASVPDPEWSMWTVRQRLVEEGLSETTAGYLAALGAPPATRLLITIDQVEEMLTQAAAARRRELSRLLAPAVADGSVQVVLTMRAEFLDHFLADPDLGELPLRSFPLRPLGPVMLRKVVEEPMKLAGIQVDDELVTRIVADTGSGEALPLLAYALWHLTHGLSRGAELTAQAYDDSGGVPGALNRVADTALREAVADGRRGEAEVLDTLLRMVAVDRTGHSVRVDVDYGTLDEDARADVDTFVRRRLLTTDLDTDTPERASRIRVHVTHEAFLTFLDAVSPKDRGAAERIAHAHTRRPGRGRMGGLGPAARIPVEPRQVEGRSVGTVRPPDPTPRAAGPPAGHIGASGHKVPDRQQAATAAPPAADTDGRVRGRDGITAGHRLRCFATRAGSHGAATRRGSGYDRTCGTVTRGRRAGGAEIQPRRHQARVHRGHAG